MRTAILVEALVSKYGSISGASRQADIPLSTLFKLQREHVDVRVSTLVCVANALGCPVSEVMRGMEECDDATIPTRTPGGDIESPEGIASGRWRIRGGRAGQNAGDTD